MLVREIMLKYHERVPFPWTLTKIKKAGLDPASLMTQLGADLKLCTDANGKLAKGAIEAINKI